MDPSNGMSYSQVCGTVRVHPAGTPDGFASHNNQITRKGQSVNHNYVDGCDVDLYTIISILHPSLVGAQNFEKCYHTILDNPAK